MGTEAKDITASYGDGETVTVHTFTPPVLPRSLTVQGQPSYEYMSDSGKYTATYNVIEEFSDGHKVIIQKIVTGLSPNSNIESSVEQDGISTPITYFVPAAPSVPAPTPVATNVVVQVTDSKWTGKEDNGGNVQEKYTLSFNINGEVNSVNLSTNFTKKGTDFVTQHLTYDYTYNNQTVSIMYDLIFVEPAANVNTTTN